MLIYLLISLPNLMDLSTYGSGIGAQEKVDISKEKGRLVIKVDNYLKTMENRQLKPKGKQIK